MYLETEHPRRPSHSRQAGFLGWVQRSAGARGLPAGRHSAQAETPLPVPASAVVFGSSVEAQNSPPSVPSPALTSVWTTAAFSTVQKTAIPTLGPVPCPSSLFRGQPTPVFLPGESHRQRSLVGCSPWDHKESDTSE